ncbi:hypothetical protein [Hymenobacter crusticola]|uniref:Uncharacterized protein n=1 Tax=Hymenobacter crusticola TaxID=1770526 RepID=A0A243W5Y9_9BACT|nr:hypothetical protein [Hymenobacter crusticola]OUJ69175.1 hypothetical protein BXP70_26880 [Hymenobacter crusticola]
MSAAPTPIALRLVLQALRQHLLVFDAPAPYAPARLRRIADQLEYVVQAWPAEQWPARPIPTTPPQRLRHAQRSTPERLAFQKHLRLLQASLRAPGASPGWAGVHSQLLALVLALL